MPAKQSQTQGLDVKGPSSAPHTIHVSPSTCFDLTLFKDILKEYRRLDDTIVMRLNRANAAARDQNRHDSSGSGSATPANPQDQACLFVWRELVENWKRRNQLVDYCVSVVDQSLGENRKVLESGEGDESSKRKAMAAIYADEVKRRQVRNETTVENIVRGRAMTGFRARCQYFDPPQTDLEARKLWEDAQK